MINMLRPLMDIVDSVQKQMDDVSRDVRWKFLRKNHKEMLEIKTTATKMKTDFDGLINRLGMAEQRISKLATITISIESSMTEKQTEKRLEEKQQNIHELWGNYKRCNILVMGLPRKERKRKEQKKYLKNNY